MLGWSEGSWGYHGDDGNVFYGDSTNPLDRHGDDSQSNRGNAVPPWGPLYTTGDVIGCGVNFEKETAFYTKNGELLGESCSNSSTVFSFNGC
jgi:Ran-binding protein 9/10